MRVKIQSNPKNPRERAAQLDALGDSLARINLGQIEHIDAPCCAPCAGVSLCTGDALKDAASMVADGRAGPVSIVAYSMANAMKKGQRCAMRHETIGTGIRPVYYTEDGKRHDPLAVYGGQDCGCGKLKGAKK